MVIIPSSGAQSSQKNGWRRFLCIDRARCPFTVNAACAAQCWTGLCGAILDGSPILDFQSSSHDPRSSIPNPPSPRPHFTSTLCAVPSVIRMMFTPGCGESMRWPSMLKRASSVALGSALSCGAAPTSDSPEKNTTRGMRKASGAIHSTDEGITTA